MKKKNLLPPSKLKVSYAKYDIIKAEDDYANESKFDGITNFEQQTIKYRGSLTPNDLVNTILHEIFHTVNFHFGMKQSQGKQIEEDFVDCFANGLTTIFVDNPELINWIKATIKK